MGLSVLGLGVGYAEDEAKEKALPTVFQAAGLSVESMQSAVDAFRAALGDPNNANAPGPLDSGRREIAWDAGGNNDTATDPVTPFDVFLDSRSAHFTTPGDGPVAGAPSGRAPGRSCRALQQSDLRWHLQHLQPVAPVHLG